MPHKYIIYILCEAYLKYMNMEKTIIITGASKRIGAYLCEQFAIRNYNVVIHYNLSKSNAEELLKHIVVLNPNIKVILVKADLRQEKEIINMFNIIKESFSNIDILVNNVGIFPKKMQIEEIDSEKWDDIFNINLRSHMLVSREFKKYAKANNAKIINFSSLGGREIWKNHILYNVSKAAVITLTESLARELAPNIAVNCICPGIVKLSKDEIFYVEEKNIPMRRYASKEDIFEAVYFFASCSNYITGQILTIDGGMHLAKKTMN